MIVDQYRAHLVDWAWATRGAAWLDAGYWLTAEGDHTRAERWAARVAAFRVAPPAAVKAFAVASESVWAGIAQADLDPWTHRVHQATKAWAAHRTTSR
jgi:hypothetical protein